MRLWPFALVLAATTASAAVPTVAVLPFRDLAGGKASVGEAIRETVTTDLKTLGGVRVVERAELDRVLGEQHLQGASDVDPATAARLGKMLGATLIAVGAYQQAALGPSGGAGGAERSDKMIVRLTARFIAVETGEVVGTAKVDGHASDFLRLQDKVTAELLRSAGLRDRVKRVVERQRPSLKGLRAVELYGDAVVADNDDKKKELLELAVAEDSGFTYAATDLAALEKRMKQYEAVARVKQTEKTQQIIDAYAKEKDPQKQAQLAPQLFGALYQMRRYRTLLTVARSLSNGPAAEMAMYQVVLAESMLKENDAALRDGEAFLRKFPSSPQFTGMKMTMDNIIRQKREVEEGKAKVASELARLNSDQKWNLCRVATEYSFAHQYAEAQRLYNACFAVGGVDKHALPQLIADDVALGDWAAARRDLALLEKLDPDMYRNMKAGYEMAIPSDV